jgi:hypothetical protein
VAQTGTGVTSTADRYVELPIAGYKGRLLDTGVHLNGTPWVTSGIPAVPTVNATWSHMVVPGGTIQVGQLATGSPEGVVSAAVGSRVLRLDNNVWYVKESGSGNTGWRAETEGVVATSIDYTVVDGVRYVKGTGGASGINVTLPTPTANRVVDAKKVDTGAGKVTIVGTVDGVVNPTLDYQGDSLTMVGDGTNWESF